MRLNTRTDQLVSPALSTAIVHLSTVTRAEANAFHHALFTNRWGTIQMAAIAIRILTAPHSTAIITTAKQAMH